MKNSIDHIIQNIIQMRPNFISLELVKKKDVVGQKIHKF